MACYLGISLVQALLMDVAFAVVFVLYAFVFNWVYDRILSVPARQESAVTRPSSPGNAPRWMAGWMKGKPA